MGNESWLGMFRPGRPGAPSAGVNAERWRQGKRHVPPEQPFLNMQAADALREAGYQVKSYCSGTVIRKSASSGSGGCQTGPCSHPGR